MMAHDSGANLVVNIRHSARMRPEVMGVTRRHSGQSLHHVAEKNGDFHDSRLHRQPDKSDLRQRTRCPTVLLIFGKPAVGRSVVDMVWPRQSEQDVDIEQGGSHS